MSDDVQSESEVVQTPTRVGHCKADPFDVYIGRGAGGRDMLETPIGKRGWLGNPHSVDDYGREGSIERFRKAFEHRLETDDEFRARVRDLAGKRLGCWCQRLDEDEPACHGEVIAEHADRLARGGELVTDGGEEVEAEVEHVDTVGELEISVNHVVNSDPLLHTEEYEVHAGLADELVVPKSLVEEAKTVTGVDIRNDEVRCSAEITVIDDV